MSDKRRYPASEAQSVADELIHWLEPDCEQLAIAGSLRRRKDLVGDVELLFIPKITKRPNPSDLFSWMDVNLADEMIATLERAGILTRRKSVDGRETFGPLNKLMLHKASGIPVDLFTEPSAADWWRSLVIRTGPKELNIRLISTAAKRGVNVHAYRTGLTDPYGSTIACKSEEDFFNICGVKYLEPENRVTL